MNPGFPRAANPATLASAPMVAAGIRQSGSILNTITSPNAIGDGTSGDPIASIAPYAFSGTAYDRIRSNAAAIISAATQPFALQVAEPGDWPVTNHPAAATQATATKAAGGAGVRHICTGFVFGLSSSAAAAFQGTVVVRDGASGAGTIIFDCTIAIPATADTLAIVSLSGIRIVGSPNTAMTFEFTAAGPANTQETVTGLGFSTI